MTPTKEDLKFAFRLGKLNTYENEDEFIEDFKPQSNSIAPKDTEQIIRSYVKFDDINQSEPIEILPLTISDMLIEYAQSNFIESLISRNYNAQIRRGQINDETSFSDLYLKIDEELTELSNSYFYNEDNSFDPKELADIILVCFSMAKHFNIDIMQVLADKVE